MGPHPTRPRFHAYNLHMSRVVKLRRDASAYGSDPRRFATPTSGSGPPPFSPAVCVRTSLCSSTVMTRPMITPTKINAITISPVRAGARYGLDSKRIIAAPVCIAASPRQQASLSRPAIWWRSGGNSAFIAIPLIGTRRLAVVRRCRVPALSVRRPLGDHIGTSHRPDDLLFGARTAAQQIGLPLRAGLHTGEIEIRSKDIGGIGVHAAAHVMAKSQPTEVLVSRVVTDLVSGAGLKLSGHGSHELKGLPGRWDLFAASVW